MCQVKVCNVCGEEKQLLDFKKANENTDGRTKKCKDCFKNKRYTQEYLKKPKEGFKFCSMCKEEKVLDDFYFREKTKGSRQPCCKICNKQRTQDDRVKHKKKRTQSSIEYNKKRILSDPIFKFKNYLRHTVKRAAKRFENKGNPSPKAEEILGCTLDFFIKYIESQFEDGMTWSNHGHCKINDCDVWNIDHIVPLKMAEDRESALKLNHYTNLQPLWALHNLSKGSKIIGK